MLEKQNAESNLALLRTQINPHFLFNTLHNIDTLIMDNQAKASKALIKLSDIMRYMLNESHLDHVSLEKELDYIENYISLEKLRIKNPNFVKYTITGDYKEIKIAPMLFLPFIENAFKHSVDTECENGLEISININKNFITLNCENKFDKTYSENDNTHGIGLDTVKKRLELIYPGKHKLKISKNDSLFKAELQIEVNDN
jgi:LytS/YehU family sensor histidine kinase